MWFPAIGRLHERKALPSETSAACQKGERIMWTVVYMTQDSVNVEEIRTLLEASKIISKVRALKKSDESYCYEILVPASEVCLAHGLILETEL